MFSANKLISLAGRLLRKKTKYQITTLPHWLIMTIKKKGTNKKLVIAIILVAILAVAAAAIVFTYHKSSSSPSKSSLVGVQVGDTFTYNITGSCSNPVPSVDYPGFYQLNQTEYFKVTVTGIEGTTVSLQTDWAFQNGTDVQQPETIDLSNGYTGGTFWGLYPANLKVGDSIYPYNNTVPINATITQTYATTARQSDFYHVSTTQYLSTDPTQSTERILYDEVWFDKQTGILTGFSLIIQYNNPQLELEVIYVLTSSTVWNV